MPSPPASRPWATLVTRIVQAALLAHAVVAPIYPCAPLSQSAATIGRLTPPLPPPPPPARVHQWCRGTTAWRDVNRTESARTASVPHARKGRRTNPAAKTNSQQSAASTHFWFFDRPITSTMLGWWYAARYFSMYSVQGPAGGQHTHAPGAWRFVAGNAAGTTAARAREENGRQRATEFGARGQTHRACASTKPPPTAM
jgi:hypothetical protein